MSNGSKRIVAASTPPNASLLFADRMRQISFEYQFQDLNDVNFDANTLSRVDPERIAHEWHRANIQYVFAWAKSNQGDLFYNSKVGHKHSGLGTLDWLGAIIAAAKKYDIKIGAYFNFNRDSKMWALKPKWRQRWQDGTGRGEFEEHNPDWENMCHNSPYRDYILALLKEITTNYDIHGYWLDRVDWGGTLPDKFSCACAYCQAQFEAESGHPIPKAVDWSDPVWRQFVLWRSKCLTRYMQEVNTLVKSIKPHVVLGLNYFGPLDVFGNWFHGQDMETILEYVDGMNPESHYEREGHIAQSVFGRLCRGASGGKPYAPEIFRGSGDFDYITKPVVQMQAEAYTALANGAAVFIGDPGYPEGTPEPTGYDAMGQTFAESQRLEPWVIGAQPVPFVGLYYSKRARVFYGRNNPEEYNLEFLGTYKALLEGHVIFDVVTDKSLTTEGLAKYKLLILPDSACMTDDQAAAIRRYVANGGSVIASHKASLLSEFGDPREDFALADVFGCRFFSLVTLPYSFIKVTTASPLTEGVPVGLPLGHRDRQLRVLPIGQAETPAMIVYSREDNNRVSHYADPPLDEGSRYPAVVASQYEKGRVVYFAGLPGAVFARWGHPEFKRLLLNAVRWAVPGRWPLRVDAPMSVETTLFSQPEKDRLMVHLVNLQSEAGRSIRLPADRYMG